jgi:hypothetical protein
MTRDELTNRILELFPQLAEVELWDLGRDRGGRAGRADREARQLHRPR